MTNVLSALLFDFVCEIIFGISFAGEEQRSEEFTHSGILWPECDHRLILMLIDIFNIDLFMLSKRAELLLIYHRTQSYLLLIKNIAFMI